jgi:large subunit ribosomal protein L22
MQARAMARSVGMSPRKMRMVVDLIRGRGVNEAYSILKFSKKAATTPVEKTLRSAVANATQKAEKEGSFVDVDDLVVREAYVNEGRTLKRFSPRAMGRATPIEKTLRSAVANATQKAEKEGSFVDVDDLVVKEAYVDEGRTLKRFSPRAMGRATPILKRTSHVTIVVDRADHKE